MDSNSLAFVTTTLTLAPATLEQTGHTVVVRCTPIATHVSPPCNPVKSPVPAHLRRQHRRVLPHEVGQGATAGMPLSPRRQDECPLHHLLQAQKHTTVTEEGACWCTTLQSWLSCACASPLIQQHRLLSQCIASNSSPSCLHTDPPDLEAIYLRRSIWRQKSCSTSGLVEAH